MCKVEVVANKLGHLPLKGDYYHLHIVFTDASGHQTGLRGGPSEGPGSAGSSSALSGGSSRAGSLGSSGSGSNPSLPSGGSGPFGNIKTNVADYDPEFIDYPKSEESLPTTTIVEGPEACPYLDKLKTQFSAIENSHTPYNPLGPNSNTTVFTALSNVGLTPKAPDGVWAPGANDKISTIQSCAMNSSPSAKKAEHRNR